MAATVVKYTVLMRVCTAGAQLPVWETVGPPLHLHFVQFPQIFKITLHTVLRYVTLPTNSLGINLLVQKIKIEISFKFSF